MLKSFCHVLRKNTLKTLLVLPLLIGGVSLYTHAQNIGINSTGNSPNSSAALDIAMNNKGLVIPRISLPSTTDQTTIATPETSLIVHNSNASMTGGSGVGLYQWNGSKWLYLVAPTNSPGTSGQVLTSQGAATPPAFSDPSGGGSCFSNVQRFTSGGTFTVPAGVTKIKVEVVGGGGGGGSSCTNAGSGGGGGGISIGLFTVTPGTNYTVTVAGAVAGNFSYCFAGGGSNGGTSSFVGTGINMTATGGSGGTNAGGGAGIGGIGSGGYYNSTLGGGGLGYGGEDHAESGENGGGSGGGKQGGGGGGGIGGGSGGRYSAGGLPAGAVGYGRSGIANSGAGGGGGADVGGAQNYGGNGAAGRVVVFW